MSSNKKVKINDNVHVIYTKGEDYTKEAWYFNGKLHRDIEPAVIEISKEGKKMYWYDKFKLYKEEFISNTVERVKYFKNGKLDNPNEATAAFTEYSGDRITRKYFDKGVILKEIVDEIDGNDGLKVETLYGVDGFEKIKKTFRNKKLIEEEFHKDGKIERNKINYTTMYKKEIYKYINDNLFRKNIILEIN